MELLAPVTHNTTIQKGLSLAQAVSNASDWVRQVRREGKQWSALPEPTVSELRPNLTNGEDAPWSQAKRRIADQLEDLTLL